MFKKILLSSAFVFAFALAPLAHADIISDLQAQISSLLSQVKNLQALVGSSVSGSGSTFNTSTATSCAGGHFFRVNFTVGSTRMADVSALTTILKNKEGLISQIGSVYSGPVSQNGTVANAVSRFQQKYGFAPVGSVGPLTRQKLNALYGCTNINTVTANVLAQATSTQPTISGVSGLQSSYSFGDAINLSVTGIESNGTPASDDKGYNIQAYIWPASDTGMTGAYLTPNPASSYNGTYNSVLGYWTVGMNVPVTGSYNMRIALYCSRENSTCWNYPGGRGDDTIKIVPFTVSSSTNAQPSIAIENSLLYPSQNVNVNTPAQVLGGFDVTVSGSQANVFSLDFGFSIPDNSSLISQVTNVAIYNQNNQIVAGPVDAIVTPGRYPILFNNAMVFPLGKTSYVIKGRLGTGFPNGKIFNLTLSGITTDAGRTILLPSPSNLSTMTVKAGALAVSVSPSLPATTVPAGSSGVTMASYKFDASQSSEDVRITSFPVKFTYGGGAVINNIVTSTNLFGCLVYDGTTSSSNSNVINPGFAGSHLAVLDLQAPVFVTKGTSKTLTLKCNISSNAVNGATFAFGVPTATTGFNAVGITSANAITPTLVSTDGVTVTVGTVSQQSITITSPTAGNSWVAGSTHDVTWTTTGIPNSTTMVIQLMKGNVVAGGIGFTTSNDGTEPITFPATLVPGNDYAIRIWCPLNTCPSTTNTVFIQTGNAFTITAPTAQPSITVVSPNGPANYTAGHSIPSVNWNTSNFPAGISISNFSFLIRGITGSPIYELVGSNADYIHNGSSYIDLAIPTTVPAGQYKLDISCASCVTGGGSVSDWSDQWLNVFAVTSTPTITFTAPTANQQVTAGGTLNITWNNQNIPANKLLTLSVYPGPGLIPADTATSVVLKNVGSIPNTGSYTMTIPANTRLQNYNLQLFCNDCMADYGVTNSATSPTFKVVAPAITYALTSPLGGETWTAGTTHPITWTSSGLPSTATINVSAWATTPTTRGTLVSSLNTFLGNGRVDWTIPTTAVPGTTYKVILSAVNSTQGPVSNTFTITAPSITITSPAAAESWVAGSTRTVTWSTQNIVPTTSFALRLFKGGAYVGPAGVGINVYSLNDGTETVLLPANLTPGDDYAFRIFCYVSCPITSGSVFSQLGNTFTITAPTAVTVTTDPSSPNYNVVPASSVGVVVGDYRFRATNESVSLRQVVLKLTKGASPQVLRAHITDGAGGGGTAVFAGGSKFATTTLSSPILLTRDTDKNVTIRADLSSVGVSQPVTVGGNVLAIDIDSNDTTGTYGFGVNSGARVNVTGSTAVEGLRIFKSVPTFTQVPITTSGLCSGCPLLHFKVTADSRGPVSIAKFSLGLSANSVTVDGVNVYAFTDQFFSQPASGLSSDGRLLVSNLGGATTNTAIYPQQSSGIPTTIVIPAGQTRYFEVRAKTIIPSGSNYSVVTTLKGDSVYSPAAPRPTAPVVTVEAGQSKSFIWSGNSVSTSALTTSDWSNGYGIEGLPAGGISQARTN